MAEQVILVTGVFDLLHQEHENFLRKAKALGGKLIVGVESDSRVRKIKGPGRPINTQTLRCQNILNLAIADEVFMLPEEFNTPDDHRALLLKIKPTILAVSSHSPHRPAKERLMQEIGGKLVVVHDHNPEISTTKLIAERGL